LVALAIKCTILSAYLKRRGKESALQLEFTGKVRGGLPKPGLSDSN
jgi:hypothetical protein